MLAEDQHTEEVEESSETGDDVEELLVEELLVEEISIDGMCGVY
jgi:mycofactocin precursor